MPLLLLPTERRLEKTTTNKDARALLIWTFPWAELGGVSPGAVSVLEMVRPRCCFEGSGGRRALAQRAPDSLRALPQTVLVFKRRSRHGQLGWHP